VNVCILTPKNKGRGDGYINVIEIVLRNSAAGGSVCDVAAPWTECTTSLQRDSGIIQHFTAEQTGLRNKDQLFSALNTRCVIL
jgi:hypothetical protein